MMNTRDNFFKAIKRQNPETIPFTLSLCDSLKDEFYRRTGQTDYEEYFGIPFRSVELKPTRHTPDYGKYCTNIPSDAVVDEWGVAYQKGSVAHFDRMYHLMEHFTDVKLIQEFPVPDVLEDYRWEGLKDEIERIKKSDRISIMGTYPMDIFEASWFLRGMDNLLMDFYINPEIAEACLDRMTVIKSKMAQKWAETGIDVIIYGDDVGTQKGMMINPELWRVWLKPRLAKIIQAAKGVNPEVLCFYHSDGNIEPIITDLIDIGVDILNPIQPECMDPIKIKKLYGDKVSFWGAIGTQTVMPFGSVEEVKEVTRSIIHEVGYNGGLVVAPSHLLEPEVPWENIEAFVETVKSFDR